MQLSGQQLNSRSKACQSGSHLCQFCLNQWGAVMRILSLCSLLLSFGTCNYSAQRVYSQEIDLILHHGKLVTVDANFTLAEAVAIRGERIVSVGSNDEILKLATDQTLLVDLAGKTVLPGLIDSHVHATGAAVYEFDHPVPEMETIADVLAYIQSRTQVLDEGAWINISQVFVTRLRDQRFPTRYELDLVAPKHPVIFRTGPDAAVNSLALQLNGIDKDFTITDGQPGSIERDPQTGEPNGILRSCTRLIKAENPNRSPSIVEQREQLKKLFADYNATGITSVCDRSMSDGALQLYESLAHEGQLTCRVFGSYSIDAQASIEDIRERMLAAAQHPRHAYNNQVWLRGVKIFLDGGMLTGSAYMQQPWGVSTIYSINDPNYRGLLYVEPDKLYEISKLALANDLQMTAHAVGDAAVQTLIDTYAKIHAEDFPVNEKRPCITHCNFMSEKAIVQMQQLGIVADIQPVWLWLDGKTLLQQFGAERTTYFQPYRTLFDRGVIVGGGSDHMQKIGSLRAVNPYNPFLGMWITLTRSPRWMEGMLHAEQRITRAEAIRFYTLNNAYLTYEEREKGSLEAGKLADLIVLDRDILECPVDEIRDITVEQTYLGGQSVFARTAP